MAAAQPVTSQGDTCETPASMIDRLRAGDRAAMDALIQHYASTIHLLVSRLTGWAPESADLVQDVFASALMALPTFRGDADIETWLTRIAINRVRRWQRRQIVHRLWHLAARRRGMDVATDRSCSMERDETSLAVRKAISELSPAYREVVTLRYLEERSAAETAELLGVRVNTVDVRLHRAREALSKSLAHLDERRE